MDGLARRQIARRHRHDPGHDHAVKRHVEHPELIAQRLGYWIAAFGRERVIAGTDCGFASFAGNDEIHESIVWAKFQALVEGAAIASKRAKAA